ncbi:Rne/Rng family ribonuclease [Pelagibacteraceae bacterium]|nr:Rne/Rng family ribonuclease [Pelagibacteraceae bacterium]
MSKNILIDTTNNIETRIAVTDDGKLDDFEIEQSKKNAVKGDIYLAKITRIEPSLQAAFVDFGTNRNGFLPLTEIHPDYFKIPAADEAKINELNEKINNNEDEEEIGNSESANELEDLEENNIEDQIEGSEDVNEDKKISIKKRKNKKLSPKKEYFNFFRKYKIQDVIRPKQVLLVQINKEERGLKGAALTTFLSFAGRYCVLMPNSMNSDGISRKIGDIEERKKLKKILSSVEIPEKMSVIVRTAGIGRTKKEISKDLSFLVNQWNKIRELTLKSEAPEMIHEEGNVLKRAIRDMLSEDIDKILVEGKEGYAKVKKITKNLAPTFVKKVKQYKSDENSLFASNNIETQINDLFSLNVKLKSGGSIVINTTEALVAVDVNSGKNTSERNIENTALKTNLEAAVEIARQLRLRDLGGLVVIDFIDMDDYRNNFKVEKSLKTALVRDRARVQFGRISMFGLMELSRQRLRSSLIDKSFERCNFCKGSGLILNSSSIVDQIIKVIKEKISDNKNSIINVKCNSGLAENFLNNKKNEIYSLESNFKSKINFYFNPQYSLHDPLIEIDQDNQSKDIEKTNTQKKNKITKVIKKKKIIKTKKVKKSINKNNLDDNELNIDDKIDIQKDVNLTESEINDDEEKTGWWS